MKFHVVVATHALADSEEFNTALQMLVVPLVEEYFPVGKESATTVKNKDGSIYIGYLEE